MHKVGELDDILCDVGVVDDGKNQIVISIYTQTDQGAEYASDFIATLAARLYNDLRSERTC
jgi:beta-lactamase class A